MNRLLTQECQNKIVQVLRGGSSRSAAAGFAGITPGTLNNWLRKGEAVAAREGDEELSGDDVQYLELYIAVMKAEAELEASLVKRWEAETVDDWQAAMQLLSRRFPDRWASKQRVEPEEPKDAGTQVHIYLPSNGRDV